MIRFKMSAAAASVCVLLLVVLPVPIFSGQFDSLAPKAPPVLPVEDFTNENDIVQIGGTYMKQTIDTDGGSVIFNTYGIIANGVSALPDDTNSGWGFSGGVCYLSGTMDMDIMDADLAGMTLPVSLDIAWRPMGTPEGSNLMLFGGVFGSYIMMSFSSEMEIAPGSTADLSILVSGFNYGIKGGAKAAYAVNESFKIIPYIFLQRTAFSMDYTATYTSDTYSSSDSDSISAPAVTSVIYGFDLMFGDFSVGTMLDILKSDNKNISFSASYKFPVAKSTGKFGS